MADKKISELPAAVDGQAGDLYPVVQGAVTRRQTRAQLKASIQAAASGANSDITSLSALTTALSVAQGGTGGKNSSDARNNLGLGALSVLNTAGVADGGTGANTASVARTNLGVRNPSTRFIDGFELSHGSPLSLSAGSAWVPGIQETVESSVAISVPLAGLTGGTFYHLYVFKGASGAIDRELVTTAPQLHASGAWVKTGEASRRYVASVLANSATSVYAFVQDGNRILYNVSPTSGSIFEVLNGSSTTSATVSCAAAVPATAVVVNAICANQSATAGTTVRISNPTMGAAASANHRQFLLYGSSGELPILLGGNLQFNYAFDSAPSAGLIVRVNGYTFRR